MQAKYQRTLQDGQPYEAYFGKPSGLDRVISKHADAESTVDFMVDQVYQTLYQTKAIAHTFVGKDLRETCRNVWNWIYKHIQYQLDTPGIEEIETPNRIWFNRETDCDGYTTLASSILLHLGIPHFMRVTAYTGGSWQHIYVVVPVDGDVKKNLDRHKNRKSYIVIDPVPDQFDWEAPYSQKFDTPMELRSLEGLGNLAVAQEYVQATKEGLTTFVKDGVLYAVDDDNNVYVYEELEGLNGEFSGLFKKIGQAVKRAGDGAGKVIKKAAPGVYNAGRSVGLKVEQAAQFVADKAGQGIRFVNRFANPGTILIRNGWLEAMKGNFMGVAGTLKWGYATPEYAYAKVRLSADDHAKLKRKLHDIETIYWQAGGLKVNLRKGILTGGGNKGREVPLSEEDMKITEAADPEELAVLTDSTPAPKSDFDIVMQWAMYSPDSEAQGVRDWIRANGGDAEERHRSHAQWVATGGSPDRLQRAKKFAGLNGFSGLSGGPALAAVSAAVAGVAASLASIAGAIKKGSDSVNEAKTVFQPIQQAAAPLVSMFQQGRDAVTGGNQPQAITQGAAPGMYTPQTMYTPTGTGTNPPATTEGNKNQTLLIVGGVAAAAGVAYLLTQNQRKSSPGPSQAARPIQGLSGFAKRRKKANSGRKKSRGPRFVNFKD